MLPPKKIAPDPDYEVIDFSGEQYSNAQPIKSASMLQNMFSIGKFSIHFLSVHF